MSEKYEKAQELVEDYPIQKTSSNWCNDHDQKWSSVDRSLTESLAAWDVAGGLIEAKVEKEPPDLMVNVFQTLLIKNILEEEGKLFVVGTLIQRTIGVDLTKVDVGVEPKVPGCFNYRVNEEPMECDSFDFRKEAIARMCTNEGEALEGKGSFAHASTVAVRLPLVLSPVVSANPFRISAAELFLELQSVNANVGGKDYCLRPNLVAHKTDKRNLVCVRDWNTTLDNSVSYDIVNSSPTVTVEWDAKGKLIYAPKLRVTFYLTNKALSSFIMVYLPVYFATAANFINLTKFGSLWNTMANSHENYGTYFQNSLTIGLTIVFLIPSFKADNMLSNAPTQDDAVVVLLFLSLIMSMLPPYYSITRSLSVVVMIGTCMIPAFSMLRYWWHCKHIASTPPPIADPTTFNGRPDSTPMDTTGTPLKNVKGSMVAASLIAPFFVAAKDKKGKTVGVINPDLDFTSLNPTTMWAATMNGDKTENVKRGMSVSDVQMMRKEVTDAALRKSAAAIHQKTKRVAPGV